MNADVLCEQGTVLSVTDNLATVRVERSSACAFCGSHCVCGLDENGPKIIMIQAINHVEAHAGDLVKIAFEPQKLVALSALAYMLPLVFLFVGALLGPALTALLHLPLDGDPARAVMSLVGLVIGVGVVKLIFLRVKPAGRFTPILIEILPKNGTDVSHLDLSAGR